MAKGIAAIGTRGAGPVLRVRGGTIVETVARRVAEGFYADGVLPSERDLAVEFGVARLTVRRALERLVSDAVVRRLENGRLGPDPAEAGRVFQVGYLIPRFFSSDYEAHYAALEAAATELAIPVRPTYYSSWHDPVLQEACAVFDALFIAPRHGMPEWVIKKLAELAKPVVSLEWNLAEYGVPSLHLFPPRMMQLLFDHLIGLGHRDIDLWNISPWQPAHVERRELWRRQLERTGGAGQLVDYSEPYGLSYAELRQRFRRRLEAGEGNLERLILTTTLPAAQILIRAAADLGLRAGCDYSVATIDGEMQAELCTPAITSLERPDTCPYFRRYLAWMRGGGAWPGPLLWEAEDLCWHPGESVRAKK